MLVKVQLNGEWEPEAVAAAAEQLAAGGAAALLAIKGRTILFAGACMVGEGVGMAGQQQTGAGHAA